MKVKAEHRETRRLRKGGQALTACAVIGTGAQAAVVASETSIAAALLASADSMSGTIVGTYDD